MQLERAYFLDLLDDDEDLPDVYVVGCVTTKRKGEPDALWQCVNA
jgi:hypothetical protein